MLCYISFCYCCHNIFIIYIVHCYCSSLCIVIIVLCSLCTNYCSSFLLFIVYLFSFVLITVFVYCNKCLLLSVFVVHNYYNIVSFGIFAVSIAVVGVAKSNLLSANFFQVFARPTAVESV